MPRPGGPAAIFEIFPGQRPCPEKMPFFNTGDISIYYEVHGKGRPVLLLHGFSSSFRRNWYNTGWVDYLAKHKFQTIGLDFRGHGASVKLYRPHEYAPSVMGGDVLNLMDHLHLTEASLLGFSMGGGIALHLAMYHPEYARRVVVAGVGDAAIQGLHDSKQLAEIAEALASDYPQDVSSPLGRRFRTIAGAHDNDLKALAALMRGPGWPGYLKMGNSINSPVLIVVAERDEFMSGVEQLLKPIARARVVKLSNCDHLSLVRDQRFKVEVVKFLSQK